MQQLKETFLEMIGDIAGQKILFTIIGYALLVLLFIGVSVFMGMLAMVLFSIGSENAGAIGTCITVLMILFGIWFKSAWSRAKDRLLLKTPYRQKY